MSGKSCWQVSNHSSKGSRDSSCSLLVTDMIRLYKEKQGVSRCFTRRLLQSILLSCVSLRPSSTSCLHANYIAAALQL